MKCPSCSDTELVVTTRSDIEIDLCPRCRGVWLDRGELDKFGARSALPDPGDGDGFDDEPRRHPAGDAGNSRSRRRSWWDELFD